MGKFIDLKGKRYGRLRVLGRSGSASDGKAAWLCLCECGKTTIVSGGHLRSGHTKSCGCLSVDVSRENGKRATHGMKKTRLYYIWRGMKARCYNANDPRFKRYGGRGITVCDEWRDSFETFRDWALANGYRDDLTIDRIDNDGNYKPDNCRWSTMEKQSNNRRTNRVITYNGETHTAAEWAKLAGIEYHTFMARLGRGWTVEEAMNSRKEKANG